jgi:hypothetical protein
VGSAPNMLSPFIIGVIVFAVILAGAFGAWTASKYLSAHHLNDETKNHVTVSMAVVATLTALVLGLLISNANTSFVARSNEVISLSADILRVDQLLRYYGPETDPARESLRRYAEGKMADLFPENPRDVRIDNQKTYEQLARVEILLLTLHPADSLHQWTIGQALTLTAKIGDTRWLLAEQEGQGTPVAFIALLVFWLILLFASFGIFAPHNFISALTLTLCALAVSGAVWMILELEHPFVGLLRISSVAMRHAVYVLSQ